MTDPKTATADHEWDAAEIENQIDDLLERVRAERLRQEDLWGVQNIPDLQKGSTGVHEVGRPYKQMAQIMKYQCDRNRAAGKRSMDLVLLEEVFEALEAAVDSADAITPTGRRAFDVELVEELIQVAAVALKWAAMVERDEPRHG